MRGVRGSRSGAEGGLQGGDCIASLRLSAESATPKHPEPVLSSALTLFSACRRITDPPSHVIWEWYIVALFVTNPGTLVSKEKVNPQ